jgi:hypothetical protein
VYANFTTGALGDSISYYPFSVNGEF